MPPRPIVLIHGYSASSEAFDRWKEILIEWGWTPVDVHVANYISLTDEVTIVDLAKAFDIALQSQPGLDKGEPFDAVVHSTGMLVLRQWALLFPEGRRRLKHLVGLAPASFGSPLAHKGRSYLGRVVSGNPVKGPDFREAGDLILDALELGSRFTWDLALADLVSDEAIYGGSSTSPFVSIFCGTDGYKGLMSVVNEPGTDGTVRLAGAALNTRMVKLDLRNSAELELAQRYQVAKWTNADIPVVPIAGVDHATIMSSPTARLQELVRAALEVDSGSAYEGWLTEARLTVSESVARVNEDWQQLVFRVVDDSGSPVLDYFIDLHVKQDGKWVDISQSEDARPKVHAYGGDVSLRCFHIDIKRIMKLGSEWALSIRASSGTNYVAYSGWVEPGLKELAKNVGAVAAIFLKTKRGVEFFHPRTTTLVEVTIDRRPLPAEGALPLVGFPDQAERVAVREAEAVAVLEAEKAREAAELQAELARLEGVLINSRDA